MLCSDVYEMVACGKFWQSVMPLPSSQGDIEKKTYGENLLWDKEITYAL